MNIGFSLRLLFVPFLLTVFVFFIVLLRYLFPEPLILIVLNLLPDADMKREFSKCFSRHYTRIAQSLSRTAELDPLSNRYKFYSNKKLKYLCRFYMIYISFQE